MHITSASNSKKTQDSINVDIDNYSHQNNDDSNNSTAISLSDSQYRNPYASATTHDIAPSGTTYCSLSPYYTYTKVTSRHLHPLSVRVPLHHYSHHPQTKGYQLPPPNIGRSFNWSRHHYHPLNAPTSYYHPPYSDSATSQPEKNQPFCYGNTHRYRFAPTREVPPLFQGSSTAIDRRNVATLTACDMISSEAYNESHSLHSPRCLNNPREARNRELNWLPEPLDTSSRASESAKSHERIHNKVVAQFNDAARRKKTKSNVPLDSSVLVPAASLLDLRNIPGCSMAPKLNSEGSSNSHHSRNNQPIDSTILDTTNVQLDESRHVPVTSSATKSLSRWLSYSTRMRADEDHVFQSATVNSSSNIEDDFGKHLRRSSRVHKPASKNDPQSPSSLSTSSEDDSAGIPTSQQRKHNHNDDNHSRKDAVLSNIESRRCNNPETSAASSPTLTDKVSLKRQRNRYSCMKYRHKRARERDQLQEDILELRELVKDFQELDKKRELEMREGHIKSLTFISFTFR